jgi:starvation-inducible DNA-binding protein
MSIELYKLANEMDKKQLYALADRIDDIICKKADDKKEIRSKIFGSLLACTRALAIVAQSFHWRTSGDNYYGDHLLFDRIYGDVNDMVDGLAERGIGVSENDSLAEANLQAHMMVDMVGQHAPESAKPDEFPEILLDYTKAHIEKLAESLEKLRDADASSDGIEDFLQGLASKHEEHAYLLLRRAGKEAAL